LGKDDEYLYCETPIPKAQHSGIGKLNNPGGFAGVNSANAILWYAGRDFQ
jgi:hypothetical protein